MNDIKSQLIHDLVLQYPHPTKMMGIDTDASDAGISGILFQVNDDNTERIVECFSRSYTGDGMEWAIRDREALAIVVSVSRFERYLRGKHFIVRTDHHSLQWLRRELKNARLLRWALKLQEHHFSIFARQGKDNGNAHALSRDPSY
jgi:hypothetical protein